LARKGRARLRALIDVVTEARPEVDAEEAIKAGRVVVDGRTLTNPASLVRRDAAITIRQERDDALRGEAKLAAALRTFSVPVEGVLRSISGLPPAGSRECYFAQEHVASTPSTSASASSSARCASTQPSSTSNARTWLT
jgi:ribosomal protein S4